MNQARFAKAKGSFTSVKRRIAAFIAVVLSAASASADPSSQTATANNEQQSQNGRAQMTPDIQIKEIREVSPNALVVLEKNCPDLVQPYKLSDNFVSLGAFSAKAVAKDLGVAVRNVLQGRPARGPKKAELVDSARLAAKQLNWLPMNAELLYGEESHKAETNILERDGKLGKKYYPTADQLLTQLLSTIKEKHDYEFKLFILKNATRNAIARPGGYLYLDQGLLESPEYLAKANFALSHEIAHVLQRHETKELQSMVVDSINSKEELLKVMTKVKTEPKVILVHVKTGKDTFTQHHVDQELQSDSCAARLLSRVIFDRQELGNTLNAFLQDMPAPEPPKPRPAANSDAEKLAGLGHEIVNTPLKRHPNSAERRDNLRKIYQEILSAGQ